jgi:hypothetical protein
VTALPDAVAVALPAAYRVEVDFPGSPRPWDHPGRGHELRWWWADRTRLVLLVGSGVVVATAPHYVNAEPLTLEDCDLVLIGGIARRPGAVEHSPSSRLEIRRSERRPRSERDNVPDPGALPPAVAAVVGDEVVLVAHAATEPVEDEGHDVESDIAGRLVAAAAGAGHLVLVTEGAGVAVVADPLDVTTSDGRVWLVGGYDRVVLVLPVGAPTVVRPGMLEIRH